MKSAKLVGRALVASALLVMACGGDRPDGDVDVGGELLGSVFIGSAPVVGALVTAYRVDEDGRQEAIATSEATDETGRYVVAIPGTFAGQVELEARGAAATYIEAASGAQATFGSQTRLRSPLVQWDGTGANLDYEYIDGEDRTAVIINVWTELATDYADKLLRANRASSFTQARDDALRVIHDVMEHDYWSVAPVSLVDGPVGDFGDAELAGAMGTGFSHLARRIAVASSLSPGSVSSLVLLDTLKQDLADEGTILDGKASNGGDALTVGACPEATQFCTVSSHFLRADWAESLALFIASERNLSGVRFGDVEALLERMARRTGRLWIEPGTSPDRSGPTIAISGLQEGAMLIGDDIAFTITVEDAFALDTTDPIQLQRGAQSWTEGMDSELTVVRDETDKNHHTLQVTLDSAGFIDGAMELVVVAKDKAQPVNTTELRWTVFAENSPAGTVSGTLHLGGRTEGALVTAYDVTGGPAAMLGNPLGSGETDTTGHFQFELAESPSTTEILLVATNPVSGAASFVDVATGVTILLSTSDAFESLVSDYTDGDNITVHITPWTHVAAQFARALWASSSWYASDPQRWDDAIVDAFNVVESHFDDLGPKIDLREVRPADLSAAAETGTLNAQVRYGLIITGLSQMAKAHAEASQATAASINTLTLTNALAGDIGALNVGLEPLFNGRIAGGAIKHGDVDLDSYSTRVSLAQQMVLFIETNTADATTLVEADIFTLLDRIALDANQRLYPVADPPIAYDTQPPGPLAFTAPTPTNNAVLRGSISLRATAADNRKLTGFAWSAPAGITAEQLDTTAGFTGPWVLTGTLNLESVSDGAVTITAIATDEALNTAPVSTVVIVDKTDPSVSIGLANDGAGTVAGGGWTGSDTMASVAGTASDANAITTQYRWNGGSWTTLPVSGTSWSITNLPMSGGANTLDVRATDPAGNTRTSSATYNRDATPPTITPVATANADVMEDESNYGVSISGTGAGTIAYNTGVGSPIQVLDGATYSKYADRYTASAPNLPEWRWTISDNRTSAAAITAEYQILRGTNSLTTWAALPIGSGAGYNRALIVSSALHPEIGQASGAYSIQVRATDEYGNQSSVFTVSWTQTIKNPALRVVASGELSDCAADILGHYSLNTVEPCVGVGDADSFAKVMNGSVPKFRAGVWRLDNPNSIPVRVRLTGASLGASHNRGIKYSFPDAGTIWSPIGSCGVNGYDDILSNGTCYTKPQPQTESTYFVPIFQANLLTDLQFRVPSGGVAGACAGCAADEREIAPNTTLYVYARTGPLSWLDASFGAQYTNNPAFMGLSPTAGVLEDQYRTCDQVSGTPPNLVCLSFSIRQTVRHLTRVMVDFSATASMETRSGAAASWATAPGGTSTAAAARTVRYSQAEDGYLQW